MRIGMVRHARTTRWTSLRQVYRITKDALSRRHEVRLFDEEQYRNAGGERQRALAEEFLTSCDAVLDGAKLLEHRNRLSQEGHHVPFFRYMLGSMPRGARASMKTRHLYFDTDIHIANSTADREMARTFYRNARVRLIPFAIDHEMYYPLAGERRSTIRHDLGLTDRDRVLLYAGRLTLEKNVHGVLQLFRAVLPLVPEAHLLIAGEAQDVEFVGFGIRAFDIGGSLRRAALALGIPPERVRFLGGVDADRLRELYNIADVAVNLTLHHDENFGYAQVEAMACGTPVVGTAWGGLKDTIADGITGFQVTTRMTPAGVKVDWWEALDRIVLLLHDEALRRRMGEAAIHRARTVYGLDRFAGDLESLLADLIALDHCEAEQLRLTSFGIDYWLGCFRDADKRPPYQRGPRSFALYQQLLAHYTGQTERATSPDEPLEATDILTLATPLHLSAEADAVVLDDPLYPVTIPVPAELRTAITSGLESFLGRPAQTAAEFAGSDAERQALSAWMVRTGLLLRSRRGPEDVDSITPSQIGSQMAVPLFHIHAVPCDTDVIVPR